MDEVWKPIPGYDYAVSNTGKVASMIKGWRVLKPGVVFGYLQVTLCANGVKKQRKVHQLVAEAFLGPRPTSRHQINHKSGVKIDNQDGNLEWCTSGENNRHRYDVLGAKSPQGEAHGMAKLTETDVREIRAHHVAGGLGKDIARDYGISRGHVSVILSGKRWAHVN